MSKSMLRRADGTFAMSTPIRVHRTGTNPCTNARLYLLAHSCDTYQLVEVPAVGTPTCLLPTKAIVADEAFYARIHAKP